MGAKPNAGLDVLVGPQYLLIGSDASLDLPCESLQGVRGVGRPLLASRVCDQVEESTWGYVQRVANAANASWATSGVWKRVACR